MLNLTDIISPKIRNNTRWNYYITIFMLGCDNNTFVRFYSRIEKTRYLGRI
jgi:hypothetical protein